jgi:phosphoribosyl-ATP pyrophosphohydrolase
MIHQVVEFNSQVLGIEKRPIGMMPTNEVDHLHKCLIEEAGELVAAHQQGDLIKAADALLDSVYFALGGLWKLGLSPEAVQEIFAVVHRANMTKAKGRVERRDTGAPDAVKPDGWIRKKRSELSSTGTWADAMIVVEGADNSGKSTLGKAISLPYYSAGPAPRSAEELMKCLDEQRARASSPCVQDRLTCISQQVYSDAPESMFLQKTLEDLVEVPFVIVVYCRPPERTLMDLSTHKVKSYDTEENMEKIARYQHEYIKKYDSLMAKIPHILYDWTEYDVWEQVNVQRYLVEAQKSMERWKALRDDMRMGTISF